MLKTGVVGFAVCTLLAMTIFSCQWREPVKIGFVAGLTGKVADLGIAGRNGVQLAIEQQNENGGINGKPVTLIVRDDEQNPETAKKVIGELIAQNIELIIGPMTSSMAMAMMPQINASKSILLSPTVTTTDLAGKDDNFLRVISVTSEYATKSASYQYQKLGVRTVAVVYDTNNSSYSVSWLNGFRAMFEKLGGRIVLAQGFESSKNPAFQAISKQLLAAGADSILIISNAVDSAMFCQQIHMMAPQQKILMSEWASTERFMELAGSASEGVLVGQFLDRNDKSQRYQSFLAAYKARFKHDPGFAGTAGYDAALVALEAYKARKSGQSLKETILGRKSFQGVQQQLDIDAAGDANRRTYVTVIRGNQYLTVE